MNPYRDKANRGLIALLLLVPVPTLGVLASMWLEPTRGTPLGQTIYALCKLWILALPLFWWKVIEKQPLSWSPPRLGGLGEGLASGILIGAVIIGTWIWLGPHLVDPEHVRQQAQSNGLDTPWKYLLLCAYLSLVNSLLEEYVWRWFAFRLCEDNLGTKLAVPLSAACFTLHHVFALKAQFSWTVTLLGSIGVFTGGIIWSWFYGRYRSVWPGFISHLLVDVAIFVVGWQILFA